MISNEDIMNKNPVITLYQITIDTNLWLGSSICQKKTLFAVTPTYARVTPSLIKRVIICVTVLLMRQRAHEDLVNIIKEMFFFPDIYFYKRYNILIWMKYWMHKDAGLSCIDNCICAEGHLKAC